MWTRPSRRRADPRHRLFASGQVAAWPLNRVAVEGMGPETEPGGRSCFALWLERARGVAATASAPQAAARLQPINNVASLWSASPPRAWRASIRLFKDRVVARRSAPFSGAAHARRDGQPVETIESLSGRRATGLAGAPMAFSCQPRRHPALFGFVPKLLVSARLSKRSHMVAAVAIATSVIGPSITS